MPQPPLSGYITPIACQYCRAEAHLINLSRHPEFCVELRTFECEDCGKQTEWMNCTNYFFVDHVAADCLSHSQADDLVPERFGATRQSAAAEAKTATNAGTISQLFDRAQQDLGPPGLDNVIYFMKVGKTMDEITDPIKAALIRRGLADEQMRAKLMRDLFSPNEQDRLRALESLRDYFGNK